MWACNDPHQALLVLLARQAQMRRWRGLRVRRNALCETRAPVAAQCDGRPDGPKCLDVWLVFARCAGARARQGHVAEYVCAVLAVCMQVFRRENSSMVRAQCISTFLVAIELREWVPNYAELCAQLFPPSGECDPVRPLATA